MKMVRLFQLHSIAYLLLSVLLISSYYSFSAPVVVVVNAINAAFLVGGCGSCPSIRRRPHRRHPISPPPFGVASSAAASTATTTTSLHASSASHAAATASDDIDDTDVRISISDSFDSGNIELIDQYVVTTKDDNDDHTGTSTVHHINVSLQIKPDMYTELEQTYHKQYFCFRSFVSGLSPNKSVSVVYSIDNACNASYPFAWNGYTVCYSEESIDNWNSCCWRRNVDTEYIQQQDGDDSSDNGGKLVWTHTHTNNGAVYFSYYPPYTYNQHLRLISKVTSSSKLSCNVESLGQTLEGREMELIKAGRGPLIAWIIHRQHPGEHMAEYYAEGLLSRLLNVDSLNNDNDDDDDVVVRNILKDYTIYVVPNMNPDGAVRGYIRTNAAGANLNREWADSPRNPDYKAPTLERSPEVYYVLNRMIETGVDLFLDVHGDEALPYNFLSGSENTINWGERLQALHGIFLNGYVKSNSDMQKEFGYPVPPPGYNASTNIGTNAIANRFKCFAATLEMPFKDCQTNPDPECGWSPDLACKLGASALDAMAYVKPYLRAEGEFWNDIPDDDKYVTPRYEIR